MVINQYTNRYQIFNSEENYNVIFIISFEHTMLILKIKWNTYFHVLITYWKKYDLFNLNKINQKHDQKIFF